MITVILYARDDCHLCEIAKQELDTLQNSYPHKLMVVDVESNEDLKRAYGFDVPVIEVGPYKISTPFTQQDIRMTLGAAIDRKNQLETINDPTYQDMVERGKTWSNLDKFTYWLAKHYLLLINIFVLMYVGFPFLAPLLQKNGLELPARIIYKSYGVVCHQLAFRSFFIFGEQWVYPRAVTGLDNLITYQEISGFGESSLGEDLYYAHKFIGNETAGYKVALCQRDLAIYMAILLFGILFGLVGRRIPPLHWMIWILIGLVPIGIDGLSQLISQPPISLLPYRESTPFLRILTGSLFGFCTAWFGYPLVELTMEDTRRILAAKYVRIHKTEIS